MAFIRCAREGSTVSARRRKARINIRGALFLVLATAPWLAASYAARAGDLDRVVHFNIKAQPLDRALLEFGTQAHVQIMFAWDRATARLQTHALKGSYTGKEALAEILRGTKLTYVLQGHILEILSRAGAEPNSSGRIRNPFGAGRRLDSPPLSTLPPRNLDPPASHGYSRSGSATYALREVVVTAQKYRQREFDVPISLQVVGGSELQSYGVTNLSNLPYVVPGLYMNDAGYTHSVYLRGVGNVQGDGAMVGQYIDDADLTAEASSGDSGYDTGDVGLYDLDRVEVLKGPQGTLYGDGSMGGVIRYITNEPVLDQFQLSTDVAALFSQYGAPGEHVETMLNAPIINGTLGVRVAGMFNHDGGWIDEPVANLNNINSSDLTDVRAEGKWQPTARLTVKAMQIIHRHSYGLGVGEDSAGNFTPLFHTTLVPNQVQNSNISNVTVTYDFSGARLLSSSTYMTGSQDIRNLFDSAFGAWTLIPNDRVNDNDLSEELRLVHAEGGALRWTVGGFYKRFHDHFGGFEDYFGLAGSSLSSALIFPESSSGDWSNSQAGFADTSYTLAEKFTLGAGVRYFSDRERTSSAIIPSAEDTFTSTDPRVYAQYHATQHVNVYASASKGFRSGGFNAAAPPYKAEDLWSYDLGAKMRYPEEGLRVDLDGFYMNYSNFVATTLVPSSIYRPLVNVGKARIKGVDADMMWLPVESWRLSLNAELLNTSIVSGVNERVTGYAAGDRLPFAPKYSFTASVQRTVQWNGRPSYIEVYYYEISRTQYREPGELGQSDVFRDLNAIAGVHWSERVTVQLFAHNLLNDRGEESPEAILGASVRPRPRTFGVQVNAKFL